MNRLLRRLIHGWVWLLALGLIILSVQLSGPDGPTRFQLYAGVPYRIAADSQLLLARDGQIIHLPDGQVIRRITAFGQSEFSTNGAFLAVRSQKARVNIVRTADQSVPISVTLKSLDLKSMTINTPGTWLAISTGYGGPDALTIYDVRANRVAAMLPPDRQSIRQLLFTPDDRYLFVHGDTSTRIFDTTTWQMVYQNTSITGPFAFSSPNYLLAINTDRSFALIAFDAGVAQPPRRIPSPYTIIDAFTFSPDGQYLAVIDHSGSGGIALVGTGDGSSHVVRMALVRVTDGAVVQRFEGPAGAMSNPTFIPDGQQIMTIGPGDGITFWQVAPREPWNVGLRLLPALLGLLLLLEQVRRFIVRGM
jgi:WD40 repeat protein